MEHRRVGLVANRCGRPCPAQSGATAAGGRSSRGSAPARYACAAGGPSGKQNVSCIVRAGWCGGKFSALEVVPVVLDLRTVGDFDSPGARRCAMMRSSVRVTADAGCRRAALRPGSVTSTRSLARRWLAERPVRAHDAVQRWLHRGCPGAIDALVRLALFGRQLAERLELLGDQPRLAEQRHAQCVERSERCRRCDLRAQLVLPDRSDCLTCLRFQSARIHLVPLAAEGKSAVFPRTRRGARLAPAPR